jgi:hypothetical protein
MEVLYCIPIDKHSCTNFHLDIEEYILLYVIYVKEKLGLTEIGEKQFCKLIQKSVKKLKAMISKLIERGLLKRDGDTLEPTSLISKELETAYVYQLFQNAH